MHVKGSHAEEGRQGLATASRSCSNRKLAPGRLLVSIVQQASPLRTRRRTDKNKARTYSVHRSSMDDLFAWITTEGGSIHQGLVVKDGESSRKRPATPGISCAILVSIPTSFDHIMD